MRIIARLLIAAAFGFGYLVHHSGLGVAGAQAPLAGPTITIHGALRDQAGAPVPGRRVQVMLLEHRSPAEIEASVEQAAIVVEGSVTGADGAYTVQIPMGSIPPGYVGPDGRVEARLLSPGPDSAVVQVADFNLSGPEPGDEAIAAPSIGGPASQSVVVDAEVVTIPGEAEASAGPAVDGYDYCHWPEESYGWEDTGLGSLPYTSVGRIYTNGGTAVAIGAFNGSNHRTETFVSVGGAFFRGGVSASQDTSVDWTMLFPVHVNAEVVAQVQYRHHQLFCQNVEFGTRRYANVGEFYPWRPTGSVLGVPRSGEPFPCEPRYRTRHGGDLNLTVSRGRTRSTSGSFSIAGVSGRANLGLSTSSSTTSTTINRVTVYGQLPWDQQYHLCGSDDVAIYATWVREK